MLCRYALSRDAAFPFAASAALLTRAAMVCVHRVSSYALDGQEWYMYPCLSSQQSIKFFPAHVARLSIASCLATALFNQSFCVVCFLLLWYITGPDGRFTQFFQNSWKRCLNTRCTFDSADLYTSSTVHLMTRTFWSRNVWAWTMLFQPRARAFLGSVYREHESLMADRTQKSLSEVSFPTSRPHGL